MLRLLCSQYGFMKILPAILKMLTYSILILSISSIKAQQDTLIVKKNHSNLVILITDFVSNNFEGGTVYYLPKSNTDSLLFQIDYYPPSDFGSIEFKHLPSNKTVFFGGIVWDGLGEIEIPRKLTKPAEFLRKKGSIKRPKQSQYYEYGVELKSIDPKIMASELAMFTGQNRVAKEFEKIRDLEDFFDRVWKSINKLTIVHNLVKKNCKVGFYLYTPVVGMFNPMEAKWIIFLYLNPNPDKPEQTDED